MKNYLVWNENKICYLADNDAANRMVELFERLIGKESMALIEMFNCPIIFFTHNGPFTDISLSAPDLVRVPAATTPIHINGHDDYGILINTINVEAVEAVAHSYSGEKQAAFYAEVTDCWEELIVHELAHIEQYRSKRLIFTGQDFVWGGTVWHREQIQQVGYLNLPWEREAHLNAGRHILQKQGKPIPGDDEMMEMISKQMEMIQVAAGFQK